MNNVWKGWEVAGWGLDSTVMGHIGSLVSYQGRLRLATPAYLSGACSHYITLCLLSCLSPYNPRMQRSRWQQVQLLWRRSWCQWESNVWLCKALQHEQLSRARIHLHEIGKAVPRQMTPAVTTLSQTMISYGSSSPDAESFRRGCIKGTWIVSFLYDLIMS